MLGKAIERARTLVHRRILQVIRASFGGTSQQIVSRVVFLRAHDSGPVAQAAPTRTTRRAARRPKSSCANMNRKRPMRLISSLAQSACHPAGRDDKSAGRQMASW